MLTAEQELTGTKRQQLQRRWFIAAGVLIAALYLLGCTPLWRPTPDSALYLALGKSLARGEGFTFNGSVNTSVTPGFPAILAALRLAFGEGLLAANLFVALCGLGSILAAYGTLARLTDRATALAAAAVAAICYKYYEYSHTILTDVSFSLLFWLTAYCALRMLAGRWIWLAAVAALSAAAVMLRAPGVLLMLPMAAAVLLHRASGQCLRRRLAAAAAIAVAASAVMLGLYLLARNVSDAQPLYERYVHIGLSDRLAGGLLALLDLPAVLTRTFLAQSSWTLGAVIAALAVAGGAVLWRRGQRFVPALCVLAILTVCMVSASGVLRTRYLTALTPALLWLVLEGVRWSARRLASLRGRGQTPRQAAIAVGAVLCIIVAANLPKVLRESVWHTIAAYRGQYYRAVEKGVFAELHGTASRLSEEFAPGEPIAARADRVSMLHLLAERRMVLMPGLAKNQDPETAQDAQQVFEALRAQPDLRGVVLDSGEEPREYAERLSGLLDASPHFRLVEGGRICRIYRRIDSPATAAAATTSAG